MQEAQIKMCNWAVAFAFVKLSYHSTYFQIFLLFHWNGRPYKHVVASLAIVFKHVQWIFQDGAGIGINNLESIVKNEYYFRIFANMNSRSRSLFAVAHPSVCLTVVCNVHAPYSGGSNFWQYFIGIRYVGHLLTSTENFTEIIPGEPLHWGS